MKISMNMGGLNILMDHKEFDFEGGEFKLWLDGATNQMILHLSHNAFRKIEKAIKQARGIQGVNLKSGEGKLLTNFEAEVE